MMWVCQVTHCRSTTPEELERIKSNLHGYWDWVALRGIDQGGEDDESFLSGGFNPSRLLVRENDRQDWREEPF